MVMVAEPRLYGMMKMSKWIEDMFKNVPKTDSLPSKPDWSEEAKEIASNEDKPFVFNYAKTAKKYATGQFGELAKNQDGSIYNILEKKMKEAKEYYYKQALHASYDVETPTVDLNFKCTSPQWDHENAQIDKLEKMGAIEKASNPNWISTKDAKSNSGAYQKLKAQKEAYFKYYSLGKPPEGGLVYPTQPIPPSGTLYSAGKTITWTPTNAGDSSSGKPTLGLPAVWTFSSAKYVIDTCQTNAKQFGYHVCLGGSVLNKMESSKDLDLYFLPMSNHEIKEDPAGLLNWIHINLGPVESLNNAYPGKELPFILKGKLKYNHNNQNQRIDVFILGTSEQANLVKLEPAVEIDLSEDNVDHLKKGKPNEEWDIPF